MIESAPSYTLTPITYSEAYRTVPAVRLGTDFISSSIASLPFHAYQHSGADMQRAGERDPLTVLLRRPNKRRSGSAFIRDQVADLVLAGNTFAVKVRSDDGQLRGLVRVAPNRVSLERTDATEPARWIINFEAGDKSYDPDDVFHVSLYNPDGGLLGVSPLDSLADVLLEERESSKARARYWRRGGRPSAVIDRPVEAPEWGDEDFERFRESWKEAWNGDGIPILEDGMTIDKASISHSPREAQWLEGRQMTLSLVSSVLGIPPSLLTTSEPRNVRESRRVWLADQATSWVTLLEDAYNADVVADVKKEQAFGAGGQYRFFTEFDVVGALRGDLFMQTEFIRAALGNAPFITPDEIRQALLMPSIGADKLPQRQLQIPVTEVNE